MCCLYIDNVGIGTRAIAVIGSQAIIVVRIVGQSGNVVASRIAHVQILITRYITAKFQFSGHVQTVTCRVAYGCPVRCKTSGCHIGRV